jgi:uncharacterized protein (DUF952 family)
MSTLYHTTTAETWAAAQAAGVYTAASLASEGFIHCSLPSQMVATANRYYHGQHGLLLLAIDSDQVTAEIRVENLGGGSELFPHIYGPLNLDAVSALLPFEPDPDGTFRRLPENAPTE